MPAPADVASDARSNRLLAVVAVAACVLLAGLTFRRLFFGVDFTDESFYLACAYRFLLGDTPFVDEINPTQSACLQTLPLLRLYAWASGGIDGAVLFMRMAFLVLCGTVAWSAWLCFRPWIGGPRAALAAILCVLVVPFGIPTLSYNTLASGLFALGVFLASAPLEGRRRDAALVAAGAAHGASAIALVTYAAPALVFLLVVIGLRHRERKGRAVALYAAGAVVPVLLLLPWLRHVDAAFLDQAYGGKRYVKIGLAKFLHDLQFHAHLFPRKLLLGLAALLLVVARWRRVRVLALIGTCALPLLLIQPHRWTNSLAYTTVLALCAPVLLWLAWPARNRGPAREFFLLIWIPSALCGEIAVWTSSNGVVNAGFGYLPGAILASVLAMVVVEESFPSLRASVRTAASTVWPLCAAVVLVRDQAQPFCDDPLSKLDARVEDGPFRGLHTTSRKRDYWQAISGDVAAFSAPGRRVLFYPFFPAGYLATGMRPAASSTWTPCDRWVDCETTLRELLERHRGEGVLVVQVRSIYNSTDAPSTSWFDLPRGAPDLDVRLVLERPEYSIFLFP